MFLLTVSRSRSRGHVRVFACARGVPLYQGTPATCYRPIGAKLHAPDEWVDLESVKNVTKVLALTAMNWCGVN